MPRTKNAQPAAESYVFANEDILPRKLRRFRPKGEVSDRRWRDALGIVAVHGSSWLERICGTRRV